MPPALKYKDISTVRTTCPYLNKNNLREQILKKTLTVTAIVRYRQRTYFRNRA